MLFEEKVSKLKSRVTSLGSTFPQIVIHLGAWGLVKRKKIPENRGSKSLTGEGKGGGGRYRRDLLI